MKNRTINNNKPSPPETSPGGSDDMDKKRLSPYQFRRNCTWAPLDSKTRLAIVLHCLAGYPASAAYAIAFSFRGSHKSLAPTASRFFGHPSVRDMCALFVRYYGDTAYHIRDKFRE